MNNTKFILIVGKTCTGKDTLLKNIKCKIKVHEMKNSTTRPKRQENEDTYDFLDIEDFTKSFFNDEFIECKSYNDWFYGIKKQEVHKNEVNIAILSIERINMFYDYLRENNMLNQTIVLFLKADEEICIKRYITRLTRDNQLNYKNLEELVRRFKTECNDYLEEIEDYPVVYNIDSANKKACKQCIKLIKNFIKEK